VNEAAVPSPAPTPLPPSPAPCHTHHTITPRPKECSIETPRRKIVATALREILQLSSSDIKFSVSAAVVNLATGVGQSQVGFYYQSLEKRVKEFGFCRGKGKGKHGFV